MRGSGYDVIKKLRFRECKFALFFEHELPPPDSGDNAANARLNAGVEINGGSPHSNAFSLRIRSHLLFAGPRRHRPGAAFSRRRRELPRLAPSKRPRMGGGQGPR